VGIDAEMFVRVKGEVSDDYVRRLAWEMGGAFGPDKFWIDERHDRRALRVVDVHTQDGPDIVPGPGETFVRVSLWCRFYGVGYERGDLPFLIAVAAWLEERFALDKREAAIWYGGDSSGACAEPFGPDEREALFQHFVKHGHRPYLDDRRSTHLCSFCLEPMREYGWGPFNKVQAICGGCGKEEETTDGGATWTKTEKRR
jgi:hypothetical protein